MLAAATVAAIPEALAAQTAKAEAEGIRALAGTSEGPRALVARLLLGHSKPSMTANYVHAPDAKAIAGIQALILDSPAVGTTGTIGRVANTWWRNRAATVAFGLARPDLRDEFAAYLNDMIALQKAAQ